MCITKDILGAAGLSWTTTLDECRVAAAGLARAVALLSPKSASEGARAPTPPSPTLTPRPKSEPKPEPEPEPEPKAEPEPKPEPQPRPELEPEPEPEPEPERKPKEPQCVTCKLQPSSGIKPLLQRTDQQIIPFQWPESSVCVSSEPSVRTELLTQSSTASVLVLNFD